jgi:hypothetical protein
MSQKISPLAGKPAPASILVDIPKLLAAYADLRPDPSVAAQRVAFGTSGHRGNSFERSFNEWHILAISAPSVAGVSRSARRVLLGRLPSKVRCGTSAAGVPSARTSSAVRPNASASPCAIMLAIRRSCWSPPLPSGSGLSGSQKPRKSHGSRRVPWCSSW